ncbi:MAG: ribosomal protein L7/L12 [Solobacterium sp.]|nr:ribosomal protein L7/L12 [Solobacterium sp.]
MGYPGGGVFHCCPEILPGAYRNLIGLIQTPAVDLVFLDVIGGHVSVEILGAGAAREVIGGAQGAVSGLIGFRGSLTGLGLVDAKKLVDNVPAEIKKDITPEEAEQIKAQLVEAGATVEIK